MSDIVERLRATQDDWPAALVKLELEAADEIERLRATLDQTRRFALNGEMDTIVSGEIERLRKALGTISRMTIRPHGMTNRFTLTTAIDIARAALGEGK